MISSIYTIVIDLHNRAYCLTADHCESVDFISAFYGSALRAFNRVMCDLRSCSDDDCEFCRRPDQTGPASWQLHEVQVRGRVEESFPTRASGDKRYVAWLCAFSDLIRFQCNCPLFWGKCACEHALIVGLHLRQEDGGIELPAGMSVAIPRRR